MAFGLIVQMPRISIGRKQCIRMRNGNRTKQQQHNDNEIKDR